MHCDVTFFTHLMYCDVMFFYLRLKSGVRKFMPGLFANQIFCYKLHGKYRSLSRGFSLYWDVLRTRIKGYYRTRGLGGKRMKIHENQFKCPAQQWLTNKYSKISDNNGARQFCLIKCFFVLWSQLIIKF